MTPTVYASCVVIGEAGLLIRGASGVGKTALALGLVEASLRIGRFARLVADDRVVLAVRGGRLVARPHGSLAGLVEQRGVGILPVPHEPACVLRLVVDLVAGDGECERLPCDADRSIAVDGVRLPRLCSTSASALAILQRTVADLARL